MGAQEPFASLDAEGARISAVLDGDVLKVSMSGTVETRDAGTTLDLYWKRLDEAIRAAGLKQVELDTTSLSFMNSSGILTLVRWLTRVRSHPDYQIAIRHDRSLTWQKTNIPVLGKLAPSVVRILEA